MKDTPHLCQLSSEYDGSSLATITIVEPSKKMNCPHMMSIEQKRAEQKAWIESLPSEYRQVQYNELFTLGREDLLERTQDMSLEKKQVEQEIWLQTIPQGYREEQYNKLLAPEREALIIQTINMLPEQQQVEQETWLQTVLQPYQAEQSKILRDAYQRELSRRQHPVQEEQDR